MAKDPAFLLYSKDWLEGTAEMRPEEKGVYIDLLCYQHQRGYIPDDIDRLARLVRMSKEEFEPIWNELKYKFEEINIANGTPNGKALVNQKMNEVVTERKTKGEKNKLIGTFAYVLKNMDISKKQANWLKQQFDVNKMINEGTEWNTERLTEWCTERLKNGDQFIEDEDGNEDENKLKIDYIIKYLNEKADKSFKLKTEAHRKYVSARLNEGFTEEDCKTVIDKKVNEWKGSEMDQYLRPETLFRPSKFEGYLNQKNIKNNKKEFDERNDMPP